jgi:hypothetical protein
MICSEKRRTNSTPGIVSNLRTPVVAIVLEADRHLAVFVFDNARITDRSARDIIGEIPKGPVLTERVLRRTTVDDPGLLLQRREPRPKRTFILLHWR